MNQAERDLAQWMLQHGGPEAQSFLSQLSAVRVSSWRCPCGCASLRIRVEGRPDPAPAIRVLAEYVIAFDDDFTTAGIYESDGTLGGIDLHSASGAALASLPQESDLMTH